MPTARPSSSFADARVLGLDGESVALASLWAERPVVLAFLRHFG